MQKKNWPNFKPDLIAKVINVLKSGKINYTQGRYGRIFEKNFSNFVGNKHSVAICNGTAALEIAIKSLKLPEKSEIMVTARSFFSSASCIVNTGNIPIFLDVDLKTQNIFIEDIKKKITKKTKAIICVHLAGLPCPMIEIMKFSKKNNIKIIEDCSQAHGASINGKQVGSFGDVATWSFCTDKIISTLGEGGMLSTNKKNIYQFASRYINHGAVNTKKSTSPEKFIYNKNYFGSNYRITEIQALAGLHQLKSLNKVQKKREKMARGFHKVVNKFDNYLYAYFPSENIKCALYRFYFFIKKHLKNKSVLRSKIITELKKQNVICFTGSCPEIYLEKAFQNLKNFKKKRLNNCKLLGYSSIALDVNHTLSNDVHKVNLIKINKVLQGILKKNECTNYGRSRTHLFCN